MRAIDKNQHQYVGIGVEVMNSLPSIPGGWARMLVLRWWECYFFFPHKTCCGPGQYTWCGSSPVIDPSYCPVSVVKRKTQQIWVDSNWRGSRSRSQ